ncbi:hypothetical protein BGX29_002434 [Mortierella sp. GBA35]|nr:hypothetical protein BGX29_002434 [Mortierella sp. GBA35]
MKLIVSLTVTLALMATATTAVRVAEAAPGLVKAAVEAVAQEEVFDYTDYQSPPIWTEATPNDARPMPDDDDLPINHRRGGARGGWGHGHDRDRINNNRVVFNKKRTAIFDENAHFSLDKKYGDIGLVKAQVETDIESGASFEVYKKAKRTVKRDIGDDDEEEEAEEEEEVEEEDETEADFHGFRAEDFSFSEFDEDNQAEDEEVDENEERRLDSEAGLQDWIEEMKSEEYFDLAGHPTGQNQEQEYEAEMEVEEQEEEEEGEDENEEGEAREYDEDEEEEESSFNEDEPSPSEEELFAASWHN